MTLTNSETSRAVMSLARLEARAACSRGAERACRLLPALRPRRRWGRFSRVTGLGRDPWHHSPSQAPFVSSLSVFWGNFLSW